MCVCVCVCLVLLLLTNYDALFLIVSDLKLKKSLGKIRTILRNNQIITSWFLTMCRIFEGVRAKNPEATLSFLDVSKVFDSIHKEKMAQILQSYALPKETVNARMMQ